MIGDTFGGAGPIGESPRRQVLLVEDDCDIREMIAEVLAESEYDVQTVSNGREALEQLRDLATKPCAIVLDLMMPVMDGWQFRALQLADPSLEAIPVILLSANVELGRPPPGFGNVICLRKPVRLDDLLTSLERSCGS
jgi:CheY-like chemotaxis protein